MNIVYIVSLGVSLAFSAPWQPNARPQAPPMAGATQERRNCLGCQGCLVYFFVVDLLALPGRPLLPPSLALRHPLTHTRRQSDFCDLPCRAPPLITGVDLRMQPRRPAGAPGQHGAPMRTPTPQGLPAPPGPTGAMEGRDTDQGRHGLPRARPPRRECQPPRPGTDRPHPGDTLPPGVVCSPAGPRYCPPPAGEILGAACGHEPGASVAAAGQESRSLRAASAGLRLVPRGL
jgi:hypothetical protein